MKKTNKKRLAIIIAIIAAILVIASVVIVIVIKNAKDNSGEPLSPAEAHAQIPGHGFILDKWQTDADYHWNICQHKTCSDKLNYAAHEFDDGVVVSEPTYDAEGKTQYTCKVCGRKKTVTVPALVDPSQDPEQRPDPNLPIETLPTWLEVIKAEDFENFSFTQSIKYPYDESGDEIIYVIEAHSISFTKDLAKVVYSADQFTNGNTGTSTKEPESLDGSALTAKRNEISDVVLLLLNDKAKFEYNTELGCWVAKESFTTTVTLAGIDTDTELSNLKVKFANTFVSEISFDYIDGEVTKTVIWSFYHYKDTSFGPSEDIYEGLG